MEHFHYRTKGQIGHFFMNFHYARYKKVKKSVPQKLKNEASDHLKQTIWRAALKSMAKLDYTFRKSTNKQIKDYFLNVINWESEGKH